MSAPKCLACRKPLRRYLYRVGGPRQIEGIDPAAQWGGYGDNAFCGVTCGWRWALIVIRKAGGPGKYDPDGRS